MKPRGAVASQSHMSCAAYKTPLRPANRCLTVSAAFPFDVLFSNSIVIWLTVELNKVVECLYSSVVRQTAATYVTQTIDILPLRWSTLRIENKLCKEKKPPNLHSQVEE